MTPELARVARSQHGVVSRTQALAHGYTDRRIAAELASGRWVAPTPGVYRPSAVPVTWRSRAWVALLSAGPGAVLSGPVAGRVHRIDGTPAYEAFDVSVPASRRPRRVQGALVHRVPLERRDVVRRLGLPLTSPERTVVDLARILPITRGAHVVADALRQGLVLPSRLDRELSAASGRTGAARARQAARAADPRVEAVTEAELIRIARDVGLEVVPQHEVVVGGRFVARIDAALPDLRVGFEADGYTYHARRDRFERDHERWAELIGVGWLMAGFTPTQLTGRAGWVGATMLAVVAQATLRA